MSLLSLQRGTTQFKLIIQADELKDDRLSHFQIGEKHYYSAKVNKEVLIPFLQSLPVESWEKIVGVTGFGKFDQEEFEHLALGLSTKLELTLAKQKAINNSIRSVNKLIEQDSGTFFNFENVIELTNIHNIKPGIKMEKKKQPKPSFPFLFVNVNRSVSFYRVNSSEDFIKVNGSLITDSTIENLCQLLGLQGDLNEEFDKAFQFGNNINADMTVEDIYGQSFQLLGLPKDIIASSMGKLQTRKPQSINQYDIIKSMWYLFAINLGQLSALNARLEKLSCVIIGSQKITTDPFLFSLQSTLDFFGHKELEIFFIDHSEYLSLI